MAADELGLDPVEIRRRNLLAAERSRTRRSPAPPTTSATTAMPLDEALRIADVDGCPSRSRPRGARPGTTRSARDRRRDVRRGHRRRRQRSSARSRSHDDGTVTVRAGTSAHGQGHPTSFSMIVADRLGIPLESISSCSPTPPSCPRRRHRRVTLAPARRQRGRWAAASTVLDRGGRAGRAAARGRRRRRRARRGRPFGVAGVPAPASLAELGGAPRSTAVASRAELDFEPDGRDVPVRRPRRRRRGRHRDGPGRRRCATSRSTTAAGSSTRCSSPASSTAAWRRASPRRCTRSSCTTTDGQPAHRDPRRLRDPERRRADLVRGRQHRDADAAQPARRQGDRRVGHHRARRRPCRTPSSTRCGHLGVRHLDMPCTPSGCGRPFRRRAPAPCPRCGGSRRPSSPTSPVVATHGTSDESVEV